MVPAGLVLSVACLLGVLMATFLSSQSSFCTVRASASELESGGLLAPRTHSFVLRQLSYPAASVFGFFFEMTGIFVF